MFPILKIPTLFSLTIISGVTKSDFNIFKIFLQVLEDDLRTYYEQLFAKSWIIPIVILLF